MRFKIQLTKKPQGRMLPMDYQYYIGAWIYKVIGNADRGFAQFLHSQGYANGNKKFKLFNYSLLDFGKPVVWKEKSLFEIKNEIVSLKVSFLLNDAAEKFIIGLFNNQQVYLGDKFNGVGFMVSQVERLPCPGFSGTMVYRATSPVVVSSLPEGMKYARYHSPGDEGYDTLIKNHLIHKYSTIPGVEPLSSGSRINFSLGGKPKSKLVVIKPYTPQQSKVRGFIYSFKLTAPVEIHRMIYSAGFGEKNATGFGWCEVVERD